MAGTFDGDFAILVPRNSIARDSFSNTCSYVQENKTYHLRFLNHTGSEQLPTSSEPVESSTEYDTCADTGSESSPAKGIQHIGHYVLSLKEDRLPGIPRLGWRVGRGSSKFPNRNVDLLLAKPGDNSGRSLANTHMIFYFNQRSGYLMLEGGSRKAPVECNIDGTWIKVGHDQKQLIYQHSTILRAGACEYEFKYTIEKDHQEAFFKRAIAFFEALSPDNGNTPFQKLPWDKSIRRGGYLDIGTLGSGSFGWINKGVDTKTGDPVAIKELRINNPRTRKEVMAEVEMGYSFQNKRGLLPILDSACEHGNPKSCCHMERFYVFMPLAQSDLSIKFWTNSDISRRTKFSLLREPLEGIRTLHELGIMHRDIRPENMLIVSIKPPRASLCDYGKAIKADKHSITTIGPKRTLAPEVWKGLYTAKIDMWAYGYALAEILGYSVEKHLGSDPPISTDRCAAILRFLAAHCTNAAEDKSLVDLIGKLLISDPDQRWSAAQALRHECWKPMLEEQTEEGKGE